MPKFIQVAIPIPGDRLFTYCVPEKMIESNLKGRRVLVPFGKRILTGVIVEENIEKTSQKTKDVIEILDVEPVFTDNMLEFAGWLSEYYITGLGEVLKAFLPQGFSPQSMLHIRLLKEPTDEELSEMKKTAPKRAALLTELMSYPDYVTISTLQQKTGNESVSVQLSALEAAGWIESSTVVSKPAKPLLQKGIKINPDLLVNEGDLKNVLDKLDKSAPKRSAVLSFLYLSHLKGTSTILLADLIKQIKCSSSVINGLKDDNLIVIFDMEKDRSSLNPDNKSLLQSDETQINLNDEQESSLKKINDSIDNGKYMAFLLHGVTGSGKTLVYIHAIQKVLSIGKTALILVPEISLTPQLIDRFERFFPGQVAVLHSRLSDGERYDAFRSVQKGKARIVLGARSGIFAPLKDIGIIIVDEEHEYSYKQESPDPRYHARDAALVRGRIEDATVVLGSATPSLETMYNARAGKYRLLEILSRADKASMPAMITVDMLDARKAGQVSGTISRLLLNEVIARLHRKEGVILFQNRRGFSSMLECTDCGDVPQCPNCSVSLTYHKSANQLRCHYCGFVTKHINVCKECGGMKLKEIGFGTQRIEDELTEQIREFGLDVKINRVDLDSTSRKGAFRKLLHSFSIGETDVLVGTQMVAKGLDFERVTLVGVVNADLQLFLPDFRASERTFQLITQVSGRAGRSSSKPGEVLIQTSHPDNPAIRFALKGSYKNFYEDEIQQRLEADYPPFSRFVTIELSGKDEKQVYEKSMILAKLLPSRNPALICLGPVPRYIAKVRSQFRQIIVIKNIKRLDPNGKILRTVLKQTMDKFNEGKGASTVNITIDIDSYTGL